MEQGETISIHPICSEAPTVNVGGPKGASDNLKDDSSHLRIEPIKLFEYQKQQDLGSISLLSLPPEILIKILLSLSPPDINACGLTNKYLHDLVQDSVEVQYHAALLTFGAEDNPYSSLPIPEKLRAIQDTERVWTLVESDFTRTTEVPHNPAKWYDIMDGIFWWSDSASTAINYLKLPDKEDDEVIWKSFRSEQWIVAFTIALREHGLIATLTTTPIGQEEDGRLIYSMNLHFLEFSTGKAHPKARDNHIFFMNTHNEEPMAFMQVVGEYLTLIYSLDNGMDDCILVLNWQTSEMKMRWLAPHGHYLGHRFLTTDLLLFANKRDLTLDIFRIPSSELSFTTPTPILVLHLPQLSEGFSVESFHLCIKPNPGSSPPQQLRAENEPNRSTRSYLAKADNAIFIFRLQIYTTCFTFIVHRNALVDLVDRYDSEQDEANNNRASESKNNAPQTGLTNNDEEKGSSTSSSSTQRALFSLPYASWGPDITRWFSSERYVMVLSTWGQKHVQINHKFNGEGASIRVLDFNPAHVQRFKAKGKGKEKIPDAELAKQDGPMTLDTDNGQATLINDEVGPSGIQELSPEMGNKNITLVEEEIEADSEEVQELDWEREDEQATEELGNPEKSEIWCVSSVDRVEPAAIFAEPVWCKLPYVASSSENVYAFNDVIIDEERILGLQKDFWGFLESIEIVHIG